MSEFRMCLMQYITYGHCTEQLLRQRHYQNTISYLRCRALQKEGTSISLNTRKYPLKCLNKLLWLCQVSEYDWLHHNAYMFDRLLKMSRVLNMPGFWIWHGLSNILGINKGNKELWKCLNMAQYASIMPWYASICLNVSQYILQCPRICLKIPE